ncbi:diaminobutyrate acetyltransferase [Thiomicrorhabdus sp.]|uniref:diaminobutyrate acetyltransferase n=1 Tax=Thiomicrorhabdus sp. TaxID=2039724 RepID=UPI0029C62E2A|nr:diaminobutyrate acetyltransferase [Thiomicrorhabdus sp.]
MESDTNKNRPTIFRRPSLEDGIKIHQLISESPPLDVNSSYLYFLQSSHFAETCVVAENHQSLLGFVSGYLRPDQPDQLFVWQLAVAQSGRGRGIGKGLIRRLIQQANAFSRQPLRSIACTISPSNQASQGVFKSLAKSFGLRLEIHPFLDKEHFAGQEHEAEDYYVLKAPHEQNLNEYLAGI